MAQDGSFIRRLVSRSAIRTREACMEGGGGSLVSNTTAASEPELGHDLRRTRWEDILITLESSS